LGNLYVTTSPHLKTDNDVATIMWEVIIVLLPACAVGLYNFGYYALMLIGLSVLTCVVAEAAVQRLRGIPVTVTDGSAVLTGILYALVLPPSVAWYVVVIGAVFAIIVVKQLFGGLGNNIFNPALMGRAFVHFAFPLQMNLATQWPVLKNLGRGVTRIFEGDITSAVDAVASATALSELKKAPAGVLDHVTVGDLFWGGTNGCIGETSAFVLIVGGLYLIVRKIVDWRIPFFFTATVALLVCTLPAKSAGAAYVPVHIFGGGLMLGAFFMATDMVTNPLTRKGRIVFACGCGLLVTLIQLYGGYPEGVCFSILIMNAFVPLIDRYTMPKKFGMVKQNA